MRTCVTCFVRTCVTVLSITHQCTTTKVHLKVIHTNIHTCTFINSFIHTYIHTYTHYNIDQMEVCIAHDNMHCQMIERETRQ